MDLNKQGMQEKTIAPTVAKAATEGAATVEKEV